MLPFERNFETDKVRIKDGKRAEKLLAELPGILNLIVRAGLKYRAEGPSRTQQSDGSSRVIPWYRWTSWLSGWTSAVRPEQSMLRNAQFMAVLGNVR